MGLDLKRLNKMPSAGALPHYPRPHFGPKTAEARINILISLGQVIDVIPGKIDVTIRERSDGKVGLDLSLKHLTKVPEEVVYNGDMQQCTVSCILHFLFELNYF